MGGRHQVLVLTREGCCLCDDAVEALGTVSDELGLDVKLVDIDSDPALQATYARSIPVVFVDDKLAFKGRIDVGRLRRRLGGGGILARLSERLGLRRALEAD